MIFISVVILYYVVTLSALAIEERRNEVALLRSRGATPSQMLAVFALEGLTIVVLAVAAGPILAATVTSFLGLTPAFSGLTGGERLEVSLSLPAYLMSALGGALSFAAVMAPAVQASRMNVTRQRQSAARPASTPIFQRYYVDVLLVGGQHLPVQAARAAGLRRGQGGAGGTSPWTRSCWRCRASCSWRRAWCS